MYRASRALLILLLVSASLVLPWGPAAADPDRGRGRQDAPGQRDRQPSEEEDSSEGAGEDPGEEQGSKGADREPREQGQSEQGEREQVPPEEQQHRSSSQGPNERDAEAPEAPAAGPALSVSATPSSVRVGESVSVLVTVGASEDAPIHDAEILADLPSNLVFRSASRAVEVDAGLIRVPLGGVTAGDEVSVSLVIEATAPPTGAQHPVRIALTADEMVLRDEVAIRVEDESEGALALSQSSPLLVQVGDTGSFSMTLQNPSTRPAEDVVVVAEIAPELDVVGVDPVDEADAIQLGRSPAREDIVWLFESVAPEDEIELTWTAQAVVAGDFEAETSARASADGGFATDTSQTTYLGLVRGVRTEAGEPAGRVLRERVVTKLVPVTREVNASAAGLLPATGATPGAVVLLGTMLILSGGGLLLAGQARPARRALAVAVFAGLLTMSACISDNESAPRVVEDAGSEETDSGADVAPGADEPDEDDEPEDRVLGVRIERDRVPGDEEAGRVASETDTSASETAPPAVTETVFEEVETTTLVLVPAPEPPTERLGSRSGDNLASLSISASGEPTVASSRMITAGATEELLVSAGGGGDAITSTVTLRNLADRRLEVKGVLVLSITSGAGSASELTSRPIDVVLEPGGETSAEFSFLLPAGDYSLTGAFRAY